MIKKILLFCLGLFIAAATLWFNDFFAQPLTAGTVLQKTRPLSLEQQTAHANKRTQILFGDLHVHTSFSADAFSQVLPMMQGEGVNPPADACDFARFCSALDFWSINDHAENLSPRTWQQTKTSIRQCNAVSAPNNPDTVAFLGWEWSQLNPSNKQLHYGHKNVILQHLQDDKIPPRPIASTSMFLDIFRNVSINFARLLAAADPANPQPYFDFAAHLQELQDTALCEHPANKDTPCIATAATPAELFNQLKPFSNLVVPHGTAWGLLAPPLASWDAQLQQHEPQQQKLIEIFSGHGNSEQYRDFRAINVDSKGQVSCPEPSEKFTPNCWQAGNIIAQRCAEQGLAAPVCQQRADQARQYFAEGGNPGFNTVSNQQPQQWLDAGQCQDCFLPAYNLRPMASVQYALARRDENQIENKSHFRFGFVGSSDSHRAKPGPSYKEQYRHGMTDTSGPRSAKFKNKNTIAQDPSLPRKVAGVDWGLASNPNERRSSFLLTGGLVAAHANGKDRDSIWQALINRNVYATSGPRILLWFNMLMEQGSLPMGGETKQHKNPKFVVRAAGAFTQKPGCPDSSINALGAERLQSLCKNECYNPSDQRTPISHIEVVRIRPQQNAQQAIGKLIEDRWKVIPCNDTGEGCRVEFEDEEFSSAQRDTVYYVRAAQRATNKINGALMRCEYNDQGRCISADPCRGSYLTDPKDDCLAPVQERAWSSLIFVDYQAPLQNDLAKN